MQEPTPLNTLQFMASEIRIERWRFARLESGEKKGGMNINPRVAIEAAWIVFFAFWMVWSFGAKRIARGEGSAGVARRILTVAVAWLLLNADDPRWGVVTARFLPRSSWVAWLGALVTFVGVLFAIWARIHLGRYWSATVALKNEHKLIRSGPYARIRHPIYTGIISAIAGSAATIGTKGALLALGIIGMSLWFKARKEEALLAGEFGPAFEEHRRHTGFFLPHFS
jgi:protein-S-isoprenylcysteine O-methyltransferase Ste14